MAFAATVWNNGLEQAGDLAAILSALTTDTSRLPALSTVLTPPRPIASRFGPPTPNRSRSESLTAIARTVRPKLALGDLLERLRGGRLLPAEALPKEQTNLNEAKLVVAARLAQVARQRCCHRGHPGAPATMEADVEETRNPGRLRGAFLQPKAWRRRSQHA